MDIETREMVSCWIFFINFEGVFNSLFQFSEHKYVFIKILVYDIYQEQIFPPSFNAYWIFIQIRRLQSSNVTFQLNKFPRGSWREADFQQY